MRNRNMIIVAVATGLVAATTSLAVQDPNNPASTPAQPGQDQKPSAAQSQPAAPALSSNPESKQAGMANHATLPICDRASRIIGLEVRSTDGDRLGHIQDVVVSLEADRAPFAIIRSGGAFGIGETRTAVPFKELKLSEDHRLLTMTGTKEQFASASQAPNGSWTGVADQDWAKGVDRFYGQPSAMELSRAERQEMDAATAGQEFVRTPAEPEKGSELLKPGALPEPSKPLTAPQPGDEETKASVSKLIKKTLGDTAGQDIHVSVEQGVVTLKGGTADAETQRQLDQQINGLPGVKRVDDLLTPTPKEH